MNFQVQYRLLHYKGNADSNLSKWIEAIQPFLESLFGHLASFITTDTYYEPSAPISPAIPWTKATDPGGTKRAIEKAKATEYARELSKIESDKPRMWGEIDKHMSTESKAQVKLDAEYSKLKQNHDVLALWRLIKQVHRTQAGKLIEHSRRILRCAYKLLHNQAKRKRKHRAI